jgi:nucleoside phosphorylase
VPKADGLLLDGAREDLILNTGICGGGVEKKGGSEVGGSFNL